jgi:hypothetical protein
MVPLRQIFGLVTYKPGIFEAVTAVTMKCAVFWNVTLCSLVEIDRHFERIYCPCLQNRAVNPTNDHAGRGEVRSFITSVNFYQATRGHTPEVGTFHSYRRDNLKCSKIIIMAYINDVEYLEFSKKLFCEAILCHCVIFAATEINRD